MDRQKTNKTFIEEYLDSLNRILKDSQRFKDITTDREFAISIDNTSKDCTKYSLVYRQEQDFERLILHTFSKDVPMVDCLNHFTHEVQLWAIFGMDAELTSPFDTPARFYSLKTLMKEGLNGKS